MIQNAHMLSFCSNSTDNLSAEKSKSVVKSVHLIIDLLLSLLFPSDYHGNNYVCL